MPFVFAQVIAAFLLFQLVSSSQAAGVLRNFTIDNQDPLFQYTSGWGIAESQDATHGDFVYANDPGESLQVELPGE